MTGVLIMMMACGAEPNVRVTDQVTTSDENSKNQIQCGGTNADCASDRTKNESRTIPKPTVHAQGQLLKEPRGRRVQLRCPNPSPPTTPDPRKPRSGANARVHIHAIGIGSIHIGEPVPDFVNEIEGAPYDADFIKAAESMDHYEAMAAGHFNMGGYPTIHLKNLDLVMTLAQDDRVLSLSAGPQILTDKGAGAGSPLSELQQKYVSFSMTRIPEPYHCLVGVRGEPRLSFLFSSCESACAGERAQKVTVGGANYDFMEQKWGTPHRYPLPPLD